MLIMDARPPADAPVPLEVLTRTTTTAPAARSPLPAVDIVGEEVVEGIVVAPPSVANLGPRSAMAIGTGRTVQARSQVPRAQIRFAANSMRSDVPTRSPVQIGAAPASVFLQPPTRVLAISRWSASAWMLARGGSEAFVASNGLLGASQAGARVLLRINDDVARPVSLGMRVSSPLRRDGVEAAAGIEWQPFAGVPIRLLAERRQRVSGAGRSAFALLTHGGVGDRPVAAGFRLDAYAQAGIVGVRSRDLFADGGLTLVRPLKRSAGGNALAVGAGAWGGVQPGAARFDIGPRVTAAVGPARLSIDYRFRVAGNAAPASGPSLTLGTDF